MSAGDGFNYPTKGSTAIVHYTAFVRKVPFLSVLNSWPVKFPWFGTIKDLSLYVFYHISLMSTAEWWKSVGFNKRTKAFPFQDRFHFFPFSFSLLLCTRMEDQNMHPVIHEILWSMLFESIFLDNDSFLVFFFFTFRMRASDSRSGHWRLSTEHWRKGEIDHPTISRLR